MTAARTIPSPSQARAIVSGFQARASQLIADMQAAAKGSAVMTHHLHDAIGLFDDALSDSLNREIAAMDAEDDAADDAGKIAYAREVAAGLRRGF